MPNKRKRNPPPIATEKEGKKTKIRDRNDFVDEEPDPHSREYLYDDIDEFHSDRDKILLGSDDEDRLEKEEYEEVLPLGDDLDESEDEDDLDDDDKKLLDNDYYERMAAKDEIGSDMEDEENDGLPDAKAWGKKKLVYYDTDYVDGDYGGFTGDDLQLAEAEEKEALAIQKRLLEQINEDDFGIDWLKPVEREKGEVEEEKVTLDLSRMSKNEKLELLQKESPEFLELIDDFKTLLLELMEKLNPLIPYAKEGKLSQGVEYVLFKHQLILLYCANISFYMVLKSRGNLRRNHPVIKKLAYFKKFLKELKVVDDKLAPYVKNAIERIKNNQTPEEPPSAVPATTNDKPKKKKLRIIKEMEEREKKKTVRFADDTKGKKRMETQHEKEALQMYELTKERRQQNNQQEEDESASESDDEEEEPEEGGETNEVEEDNVDEEEMNEKRGITYQIAKNKGLMPHRKKEHKNPRVKHRMKFRKAKIRRKGQVREVRTEKQRYGGEISGIRIGVKHGRKLK